MSSEATANASTAPFHAVLPLDGAALGDVRARLRTYLEARGVAGREAADVVLSVEEVAINAIRHSHGQKVDVLVRVDAHVVYAQVRDDGVGFRRLRRVCPDPWRAGGRGLFLVRSLMDDVTVDCSGGALIMMRKRLDGGAPVPGD
jgi:anti-sigma regulatory factor (Ser/Thr protein kinase)